MSDLRPPLVLAHRGASAREPENTLRAFRAAEVDGADMIELDVRLTADGVPVVIHDDDLARTTDGTGRVHRTRLDELKRLDASGGRGEPEPVPTLAEALAATTVALDVELKDLPGEPSFDWPETRLVEATLEVLSAARPERAILLSSFDWLALERVRALAPDLETGFLTIGGVDPLAAVRYAAGAGHRWILPQAPALLEAGGVAVERAHEAGLRVGVWTVDAPDLMQRLFAWGVDALATNEPAVAVEVRDSVRE
ncbi:MAG TPA: glycerophosphodiester phosphodiesterase family protein [Actinomycetota bacterium]|nr:glycerophosphodiester phosphodiesterase family protein [Actinomycetota bacterium]